MLRRNKNALSPASVAIAAVITVVAIVGCGGKKNEAATPPRVADEGVSVDGAVGDSVSDGGAELSRRLESFHGR